MISIPSKLIVAGLAMSMLLLSQPFCLLAQQRTDPSTSKVKVPDTASLKTPKTRNLKEVTVSAQRSIIKQKADRVIYDLEADPESKSNSVLAMMHKIPFISLDADDNILVKGNTNFKVLLNGRPSPMLQGNLREILRSIPASTIQRIEVITIPPSRYDAEGLGGIINIITFKRTVNGYNGTLNLNESFPMGGPGLGGSLTAKQGKFGISAFAGRSLYNGPSTSTSTSRVSFDSLPSLLSQNGTHRSSSNNMYLGTELSFEADSLNLFSGQFNFNRNHALDHTMQSSQLLVSNQPEQAYQLTTVSPATNHGIDASVNYQIGFKRNKNQLLTFSYSYSNSRNQKEGDIGLTNVFNYPMPDYHQNNLEKFSEQSFQADYVHPLKKLTIEGGLKGILRKDQSNFQYLSLDSANSTYEPDPALSDVFNYTQSVFGAYNSYQLNLSSWNITAGIRLEQTRNHANFLSSATTVDQTYLNAIPSVAVGKTFKDQSNLHFGYSERIKRPGINRLNPFVDRSDPNMEVTGNPNLQAVLIHSIQAGYGFSKKLSFNAGLDYSYMNNIDLQVISYDPLSHITKSTYQNVGKASGLTLNLNGSYPLTSWYTPSLNGFAVDIHAAGTTDGDYIKRVFFIYGASLSNAFRLSKGWRINADLNLTSKNPTGLQGGTSGFLSSVFGINKSFYKDKLSFAAQVKNPFSKYRNSVSTSFGPDFNQVTGNQVYFRSFNFSLNYRFGGLKDGIKKSQKAIDNNDLSR